MQVANNSEAIHIEPKRCALRTHNEMLLNSAHVPSCRISSVLRETFQIDIAGQSRGPTRKGVPDNKTNLQRPTDTPSVLRVVCFISVLAKFDHSPLSLKISFILIDNHHSYVMYYGH